MFPPDLTLMCSFVTCLPLPPRVIPGHLWMLQNPVEPGRTITWLDRKSNEAWNQYVQSHLTWGMLGNGVSGVLWCCFNHRDLGSFTHKQAGYCQNNATPWVAVHVYLWLLFHCLSCAFIFLHRHESVVYLHISVWIQCKWDPHSSKFSFISLYHLGRTHGWSCMWSKSSSSQYPPPSSIPTAKSNCHLHANASSASNLAQGCICLHAD